MSWGKNTHLNVMIPYLTNSSWPSKILRHAPHSISQILQRTMMLGCIYKNTRFTWLRISCKDKFWQRKFFTQTRVMKLQYSRFICTLSSYLTNRWPRFCRGIADTQYHVDDRWECAQIRTLTCSKPEKNTNKSIPGDLKWRERTGTSCQIKIHFWIETTQYFLKYTLFQFQIHVRAIVLITKHNHKISTSFIKNNRRYNRSNTTKWISILTTLLSTDWLKYEDEIIC